MVPATAPFVGPNVTITVTGTDFPADAVVNMDWLPLSTTRVSDTQLTAVVVPSTHAGAGVYPVMVSNGTGTVTSNEFNFTLT